MKHKCDKCDRQATVHLTEIIDGQKSEKHLCEVCAAKEGITAQNNMPITKLLEDFVSKEQGSTSLSELVCPHCRISFLEFRQSGLLGCPHDYEVFAEHLEPLLARMHAGADHHSGKAPTRAASEDLQHLELMRLRRELKQAVASEAYEQAAEIRDQIKQLEAAQ